MPGQGPMPMRPRAKVKHHDLTVGRYTVTVTVGKSWQSRVSQGSDEMGQVLMANPGLMPVIGDLYFKYRDFPGHDEISERMKRMLPPQAKGPDDDSAAPDPAQLQMQLQQVQQQSGQMIEQLTQQLQQAQQALQQDQVKVQGELQAKQMLMQADMQAKQMELQAKMQQTQMEIQSRQQIAQLQVDSQMQIAQMRGQFASQDAQAKIAAADRDREDQQAHEMGMAGHNAVLADDALDRQSLEMRFAEERERDRVEDAAQSAFDREQMAEPDEDDQL